MSTRALVAALIADALPDARVIAYPKAIDAMPPSQPVVMVYRQEVAPAPQLGLRTETLAVWVTVAQTDPAKVDDLLDALLDEVLAVIEGPGMPALAWTDAVRDVLAETYPAYKITTTVPTRKD